MEACPFCSSAGGEIVWEDGLCRVIRVGGPEGEAFPGFCRVVWRGHVAEMTDLDLADRRHAMNVVFAVETALRALAAPDKINLAALGNMVPHLHWHVIPRWRDDRHFPEPVWGAVQRDAPRPRPAVDDNTLRQALRRQLHPDQYQG